MKKKLQITFALIIGLIFYSNVKAQNLVITSPSFYWNGSATIDTNYFTATDWYWSTSSDHAMNGGNTSFLNNLCAGTYTLNYYDSQGTLIHYPFYIPQLDSLNNIQYPCNDSTFTAYLIAQSNIGTNIGGTIDAHVSGAFTPYTYSWTNGSSSSSVQNLNAGNYSVDITNNQGCTQTVSTTIFSSMPDPCISSGLGGTVSTTSSTIGCNGTLIANVYGYNPPFTYMWNINNGTVSNDNTFDSLCPGSYSLIVTDSYNCGMNLYGLIQDNSANAINGYVIPTAVSVEGLCDGTASINVSGGTAPYTYLYSNGVTSASANNLCAGYQTVTITDATNQTVTLGFIIATPLTMYNNSNYPDSIIIDSLYSNAVTNCTVNYSSIDSATISTINFNTQNFIDVTWTVYYNADSSVNITTTYVLLDSLNGIYSFMLEIYCPNRSMGTYLVASDQYYLNFSEAGINKMTKEVTHVYPNPFTNNITIKLSEIGLSEISITDVMGKVLYKTESNNKEVEIDASTYSSGNYLIIIKNNNGTEIYKLVK